MTRLIWVAAEHADPEESFEVVTGRRPAPEPVTFTDATPEFIGRRAPDLVVVDGRERPEEAVAVIRKLKPECDAPFLAVLEESDVPGFDFNCGVNDFVTSAVPRVEFEARVDRLVSPVDDDSETIKRGPIGINRDRFEVRLGDELLDLTFKEFELLEYLARRPGKVCSRIVLLQEVWGYDFFGGTRTVDVHIRRLRVKLGPHSDIIETVRNVGYRFAG